MRSGELITIGGIYLDFNVPDFPINDNGLQLETEVVGGGYTAELGGSAANFARLCAALEIPTAFIGKVGTDLMGQQVSELLSKVGVTPSLIQSNEVQTNISFNMIHPNGKSIMAVAGSANQTLTPEEVYERVSKKLEQSPYLFLGGCFKLKNLLPAYEKLMDDAKNNGTKVAIDHGRITNNVTDSEKEIVRTMALKADIYFPSRDEFTQLWAVDSIEDGLRKFRRRSSAIVALKDEANGAVTIDDKGEITRIASFPVQPIHTVGAGDSFNAGFIAAQYRGMEMAESIRFACATGALKISQPKLPTYDEVIELAQL